MGFETYKDKVPFEQRKNESIQMKEKYPERVPVIIERGQREKNIPQIDKRKYLVPCDLSVGQMLYVIRKRLNLDSTKALFLFSNNNTLPSTSKNIGIMYESNADKDGFLYFTYCSESTFGQ